MKDGHSTSPGRESAAKAQAPSPALLFDTINGYHKTAAIKAAVDMDIFTVVADSPASAESIARHVNASPRGMRILCDFLTMLGFLTKSGERYGLSPDSAVFLNRKSPAYAGGTLEFLLSDHMRSAFGTLTDAVRKGGTAQDAEGSVAPEHPMWVSFAHNMGPLMVPAAAGLAESIALDPSRPTKVLDIAAGHGMWGLAFAMKLPRAQVVALDWAPVLEVARENARAAGVADRFSTIAGSAFDVDLGENYDVVLVPNFLHHFNTDDCIRFLKRAHAALRSGGKVAIVEFVPNEDRVTPPGVAGFSLIMLATTPEGDAYTFAEYADMLAQSGFGVPTQHSLPASMNVLLSATKS
jgi:ubiquinone/menaquinone biosynthesis C-methylase UbiE